MRILPVDSREISGGPNHFGVNSGPNNREEANNEGWNNDRDARIASVTENIGNLNDQITILKERQRSNFNYTLLSTGIACGAVTLACSSLFDDYQGLDRIINSFLVTIAFASVGYTSFLTYNTNNDLHSTYRNIIGVLIDEHRNTLDRIEPIASDLRDACIQRSQDLTVRSSAI